MTKRQFLIDQLQQWWGCIRDYEIQEGLDGANGTDPKDVKKFYPKMSNARRAEKVNEDVQSLLEELLEAENVGKNI